MSNAELFVAGITTSLSDWDSYVSDVIFFYGCNLRCQYCHNPELIGGGWRNDSYTPYTVTELMSKLVQNKLTDSVVLSGGEPTQQNSYYFDLLLTALYHEHIPVKMDTNGTFPITNYLDRLTKVSLDLKAPPPNWDNQLYNIITGVVKFPYNTIQRNLTEIADSDVTLEGRTTIVTGLNDSPEHIRKILEWTSAYLDEYTLQAFRNDIVYNPLLTQIPVPTRDHMEMLAKIAEEYLPTVSIKPKYK